MKAIHDMLGRAFVQVAPPAHTSAEPGEQLRSSLDPAKAARLLGWYPQVALPEGLAAIAQEAARPEGPPNA